MRILSSLDAHPVRTVKQVGSALAVVGMFPAVLFSGEQIVYGPEEFVRGAGSPSTVSRQIDAEGYEAPFELHLRNGDGTGGHRCSSAVVSLNERTIFGPSAFSKRTAVQQAEVELWPSSSLAVQLRSTPGCRVTLWITGRVAAQVVDVSGGHFDFPGGITLDVPRGALAEDVAIRLLPLTCAEVAPVLARPRPVQSHAKRCIGGFRGSPDGIRFLLPVAVTLPVAPLEALERPMPMQVDLHLGSLNYFDAHLAFSGATRVATLTVAHFSEFVVAAIRDCMGDECGTPSQSTTRAASADEPACATCSASIDPQCDPVQPLCCLLTPADRAQCGVTCSCCRQGRIEVVVKELEFSQGDCQLVGSQATYSYLDCPGQNPSGPWVEPDKIVDVNGCPDDMQLQVRIHELPIDVLTCSETTLTASITGSTPDGRVTLRVDDPDAVSWESSDPAVASFPQPLLHGLVRAINSGDVTIRAFSPDPRVRAEGAFSVRRRHVSAAPPAITLNEGQRSGELKVAVEDLCGNGNVSCRTTWRSRDAEVAAVEFDVGGEAFVRALSFGSTTIVGTVNDAEQLLPPWCQEEFSTTVPVNVFCSISEVRLTPSPLEVPLGRTAALTATIVSDSPVCSRAPLEWSVSPNDPIAAVGLNGVVAGLSVGVTTIEAAVLAPHVQTPVIGSVTVIVMDPTPTRTYSNRDDFLANTATTTLEDFRTTGWGPIGHPFNGFGLLGPVTSNLGVSTNCATDSVGDGLLGVDFVVPGVLTGSFGIPLLPVVLCAPNAEMVAEFQRSGGHYPPGPTHHMTVDPPSGVTALGAFVAADDNAFFGSRHYDVAMRAYDHDGRLIASLTAPLGARPKFCASNACGPPVGFVALTSSTPIARVEFVATGPLSGLVTVYVGHLLFGSAR